MCKVDIFSVCMQHTLNMLEVRYSQQVHTLFNINTMQIIYYLYTYNIINILK